MFSGCGKQDVQVYYWDNEGNDVLTSKMKTDRQSENGFVRNFLETYNADMETKEELLDIAGIKCSPIRPLLKILFCIFKNRSQTARI